MQDISEYPTIAPETPDALSDSAARATAWAGEPFLHEGEEFAIRIGHAFLPWGTRPPCQ